jgi:hypothetical protein
MEHDGGQVADKVDSMGESERARVGQALDLLRDALASYVDAAMVEAYGQEWDNVVAEDDAKRRSNGRKFPVSKRDLVVLLKTIIHRRIEPWSSLGGYPRIRAFASEVLSLRHIHHHGDDCVGEYARLLDTANRMLLLLAVAVPRGLEPLNRVAANVPVEVAATAERPQAPTNLLDAEVARLGESGGRLAEILVRASELSRALYEQGKQAILALDPENPDAGTFQSRLNQAFELTGAEVVELLAETHQLEADRAELGDGVWEVLTLWVRCELSGGVLGPAARLHASTLELTLEKELQWRLNEWIAQDSLDRHNAPELPEFDEDRRAEVRKIIAFVEGHSDRRQELIRLASQLDEANPLANLAIVYANLELAAASKETGPQGGWNTEALPFVRDAIARVRLDAGREPGSVSETLLVFALRLEGEICNDLGRTDDAIQAFARADEIVDRYPAADPSLSR